MSNKTNDSIINLLILLTEEEEKLSESDNFDPQPPFEITLNVGGLLISGDLISKNTYLKLFMGGELLDKIRNEEVANEVLEPKNTNSVEEATTQFNFIHLKDVQMFLPGNKVFPNTKSDIRLWRGKCESIDGFFLGRAIVEQK